MFHLKILLSPSRLYCFLHLYLFIPFFLFTSSPFHNFVEYFIVLNYLFHRLFYLFGLLYVISMFIFFYSQCFPFVFLSIYSASFSGPQVFLQLHVYRSHWFISRFSPFLLCHISLFPPAQFILLHSRCICYLYTRLHGVLSSVHLVFSIRFSWNTTLIRWIIGPHNFGGKYCIHLQVSRGPLAPAFPRHHMPENLNLEPHHCDKAKTRKFGLRCNFVTLRKSKWDM
jgi:hypothetical protein